MTQPESRVSAEDRAEIIETYARYAWGLDLADPQMLLSSFTPEGEFDHLWQGKARGHEAILAHVHELWYKRQHWWFGRQHLFDHYVMEPQAEGVRVRCFFQILQFNVDYGTNFVFGIGTRDDLLVRSGGRWLFKSVFVNAWRSQADVPWKGEVTLVRRPPGAGATPPSLPPGQRSAT